MKKSRLLEIIREEISATLREETIDLPGDASRFSPKQKEAAIRTARTSAKDMTLGTPKNPVEFVEEGEKVKKLAEKYQLDEETINEMASVVQTKQALEALKKAGIPNSAERLELVKDVEKETLAQFKKTPVMSSDGRLARKLDPEEVTGKRDTRGYGADFERNFKQKAGMDFLDFTTEMQAEIEDNKIPLTKKFTPGLATNTTEKDAASQIFNIEKGKQGRKADPNKPEKPASTGKKGRPAGEPKAKVATRTPGDDGFDKVEYSDSEDIETTQAPAGDAEMEKAARGRDELTKQYRGVMDAYKKMKAEEGDQAALEYLKTKQNIVKAYKKAQTVNV